MSKSPKPAADVATLSREINARALVRHTGCTVATNVVTMTLTCTTAPSARALFAALAQAIKAGEVSLALPTVSAPCEIIETKQ